MDISTPKLRSKFVESIMTTKFCDAMASLRSRWQDEKQHEDFNDYINIMKGLLPEGTTYVNAKKRPFSITFQYQEYQFQIFCNNRSVGWKRIK